MPKAPTPYPTRTKTRTELAARIAKYEADAGRQLKYAAATAIQATAVAKIGVRGSANAASKLRRGSRRYIDQAMVYARRAAELEMQLDSLRS